MMLKPLLIFTILMLTSACSTMGHSSEASRPKPSNPPSETTIKPTEPLPKGVELRKIDNELRAKLGLKDRDVLIALSGDSDKDDKTIIYVTDTATAVPGDFIPGGKLTQFTQIFAIRNSPTCYFIQHGTGWKLWYPKPDCPH